MNLSAREELQKTALLSDDINGGVRNEAFTYPMRGARVRCYNGVGERANFAHAQREHHELSHHHTAAGARTARAHREPIRWGPWRCRASRTERRSYHSGGSAG